MSKHEKQRKTIEMQGEDKETRPNEELNEKERAETVVNVETQRLEDVTMLNEEQQHV